METSGTCCNPTRQVKHVFRYFVTCILFAAWLCDARAAEAATLEPPKILPRSAWSAQPEDHRSKALQPIGNVKHVSVHHTAVDKLRGDGTPEAELQIIQHGHRNDNQWGDIAYHFLIAPDGRIFSGRDPKYAPNSNTRYMSEQQWRRHPIFPADDAARNIGAGGATFMSEKETGPRPGHVEGHLTICFLGNFTEVETTNEAKHSFVQLAAYLLHEHKLKIDDVWLHREVASTLCPGNKLYAWLRNYPQGERYSLGTGLELVQLHLAELSKR
jgi:hypothetical protein